VCVNLEMIQWYEHYRDSGKCDMTHTLGDSIRRPAVNNDLMDPQGL
jgi:hypothetical protein